MPDRTLASRLGQLALALLNATLLLAVLLVFGVWLLIGRIQHFAADTASEAAQALGADVTGQLQGEVAGLATTLDNLSSLDQRLSAVIDKAGTSDSPAVTVLTGLRGDVQGLTAAVNRLNDTATALRSGAEGSLRDSFQQFLLAREPFCQCRRAHFFLAFNHPFYIEL